uniref:Ubiquitin-like domain-containing protein n=1 Tax=Physcomitrium patens TaxID=3218 RepID=A0A7I4CVA5_PHYPA
MGLENRILVQVVGRNGKQIIEGGVEVDAEATLEDLKKAIHSRNRKYYPERQRITLPLPPGQSRPTPVDEAKKLRDQLASDSPQVVFKDLGPQVSYSTLFFFEYLGPLLIYPVLYFFPQVYSYFGLPLRNSIHPVQTFALYAWCFHYAKREFETFCIHRFSHATGCLGPTLPTL